ncbi:MAG: GNAT family N-acetyltransferase [Pseudomonadota bacterium]
MAGASRASTRLSRIAENEIGALEQMILRSKAHWGYDAQMMAIMARVLRLDRAAIRSGRAIAAWMGEQAVGVAQISEPYRDERGAAVELELLFIDPVAIGSGLGRRLYTWALDQVHTSDAARLGILSDPFARPFYAAMGAVFIEDRPSDAVPGRTLPWMEHRLG